MFLPLLVYKHVFYPYIFPKVIVFQILVEIIFVFWLFLLVYNKKYRLNFKNPLIIVLTIFVIILFLTSLFGVDFSRSFWSTQERMTGLLTISHFYAFFLILISVLKEKKDWQRFVWLNLICSFLVGLYGFGQRMGLKFLLQQENAYQMISTLGNSIFLAVYSMLNVFLAVWLFLNENKLIKKIISLVFCLFNLIVMLMAASRGVILAFGLCAFGLFLFLIFISKSKTIKIIVGLFLIIIISGAIFIQSSAFQPHLSRAPYFIQRLVHFTSGAKDRLDAWQIGIQGFKEKPIFGWGWENYNVIFNQYYNPWYLSKGMASTWFDRSHNQIVDVLSLTGIVGCLSYLIIFVAIFWLLFRKARLLNDLKQKVSLILLGFMLLSYFIQNLFVFDTPAPLIIFYFSLALIYFLVRDGITQPTFSNETSKEKSGINKEFPLPVLIFLVAVFGAWGMYKFNFEPFKQSYLGVRAWRASGVNLKLGLYWFEKALEKSCFVNQTTRVYLAQIIAENHAKIGTATSNEDLQILGQGTEMAIAEYKKSVVEHPFDARYWLYLGQLYGLGVKYDRSYIEEAKKALTKALEISPRRQQAYFELARIYYYNKEYKKAIEILKQAVILEPQVEESKIKMEKLLTAVESQEPEMVAQTREFLKKIQGLQQ